MNKLQKNEENLIFFENSNLNQINEIFNKYLYLDVDKDNFWLYRAEVMFSLINELLYSMKENEDINFSYLEFNNFSSVKYLKELDKSYFTNELKEKKQNFLNLLPGFKKNINNKELKLVNEHYGYTFMQLMYVFSNYKEEIFNDDLYNKLKIELIIRKDKNIHKI